MVETFFDMRFIPAISQDFHKAHIADVSSIMRVLHWASCVCYHRYVCDFAFVALKFVSHVLL